MLDQGLEADVVSDIQKYLENLINNGLRQRLISLIKVWNGCPFKLCHGFWLDFLFCREFVNLGNLQSAL